MEKNPIEGISRSSNYTMIFYGYMEGRLAEDTQESFKEIAYAFIRKFRLEDTPNMSFENLQKNYYGFAKKILDDIRSN